MKPIKVETEIKPCLSIEKYRAAITVVDPGELDSTNVFWETVQTPAHNCKGTHSSTRGFFPTEEIARIWLRRIKRTIAFEYTRAWLNNPNKFETMLCEWGVEIPILNLLVVDNIEGE